MGSRLYDLADQEIRFLSLHNDTIEIHNDRERTLNKQLAMPTVHEPKQIGYSLPSIQVPTFENVIESFAMDLSHIAIAAERDGGKTTLVHYLLERVLVHNPDCEIMICDPNYKATDSVWLFPDCVVAKSVTGTKVVLNQVYDLMSQRQQSDIPTSEMKPIVLFIDEGNLTFEDDKEAMNKLRKIWQSGTHWNIYGWVAFQNYLATVIGIRVSDKPNARWFYLNNMSNGYLSNDRYSLLSKDERVGLKQEVNHIAQSSEYYMLVESEKGNFALSTPDLSQYAVKPNKATYQPMPARVEPTAMTTEPEPEVSTKATYRPTPARVEPMPATAMTTELTTEPEPEVSTEPAPEKELDDTQKAMLAFLSKRDDGFTVDWLIDKSKTMSATDIHSSVDLFLERDLIYKSNGVYRCQTLS